MRQIMTSRESHNALAGATELQALFQSLGQPVSYQKLFNIMEQYDLDESGQLDFGEFLRLFWCAGQKACCPEGDHLEVRTHTMSLRQHELRLQSLTVGAKLRMALLDSPTADEPFHCDVFGPARGSESEP